MYSYGSPHTAAQKQDDQHERTFSSYVRIQVVVLKTCLGRWTIGRSGERGSGISVLPARYDDDDIRDIRKVIFNNSVCPYMQIKHTWAYLTSTTIISLYIYIYRERERGRESKCNFLHPRTHLSSFYSLIAELWKICGSVMMQPGHGVTPCLQGNVMHLGLITCHPLLQKVLIGSPVPFQKLNRNFHALERRHESIFPSSCSK